MKAVFWNLLIPKEGSYFLLLGKYPLIPPGTGFRGGQVLGTGLRP